MAIKTFVLSIYKDAEENFHIHKLENLTEPKKPHTHEYFQIFFISRGSLVHHVENNSSHLIHGDMFIIPPGVMHYINPSPDAAFYSFSFTPELLGGSSFQSRLAANFLRSLQTAQNHNIRPKVSVEPKDIFYIENVMEHILEEFTNKPLGYSETIRAYALLLVTLLARNYFEKMNDRLSEHFENNKQLVMHCIEYIENNFCDSISLNEITRRFAMSKSSFCKLFMQLTGHSFNDYINICRIKKATEYIKKGYKITAVCELCGYNDFSTFHRNFKKVIGVSPNEYKQTI